MSSRSLATPASKPAGGVCAAASHNEAPNDDTVEVIACSSSSCSSVTAACMGKQHETARNATPRANGYHFYAGDPTLGDPHGQHDLVVNPRSRRSCPPPNR